MKKYQKGFAPVLVLGAVVVASVALYFVYKNFGVSKLNLSIFSPSTESNTSQEYLDVSKNRTNTYVDEVLGFQFKYDSGSRVSYNNFDSSGNRLIKLEDATLSEGQNYKDDEQYFSLTISNKAGGDPIDCSMFSHEPGVSYDYPVVKKVYSTKGEGNTNYLHSCTEQDDEIYYFEGHYSLKGTNKDKIETRFNQIVSTFKLTN